MGWMDRIQRRIDFRSQRKSRNRDRQHELGSWIRRFGLDATRLEIGEEMERCRILYRCYLRSRRYRESKYSNLLSRTRKTDIETLE